MTGNADIGLAALRAELEEVVNSGTVHPSDHSKQIERLKDRFGHTIKLVSLAGLARFNCFQHAFEIQDSRRIHAVLLDDALRAERGEPVLDIKFGSEFMSRLISDGTLVPDERGSIVLYLRDELPVHAGIINDDRVISKWGLGHVWQHQLWEVPESHGSEALRVRKPDVAVIETAFQGYYRYRTQLR